VLIGFHSWMPTMLLRKFGWETAQAGYAYGAIIAMGGVTGILLAGSVSVRLNRMGRKDAELSIVLLSIIGATPFLVIAPLMPTGFAALLIAYFGITLLSIPSALAPTILQGATPNEMRAQLFAVYLFVISLGGYALGPLSVAVVTESFLHAPRMLNVSLSIVAAIGLPVSALCIRHARSRSLTDPSEARRGHLNNS
jgi:MFS family permease